MNAEALAGALQTTNLDLILWVALLIAVLAFVVFSLVLIWHWKKYSTGKYTTYGSILVYLVVSGCCIGAMAGGALMVSL